KGAEQMYGYTEKEAIGNKLFNLIKSDVTDNKKYEVWVQLKQNGFWKDIIKQHTTHKKSITALISIAAIKDDKTKLITGFTGICTDITFQKKAEE
ncbi:PAS domain-containing protein, partial [Acinetobacter baumannii]